MPKEQNTQKIRDLIMKEKISPVDAEEILSEYDNENDDGSYDVYAKGDQDAENIIEDLAVTDFKESNNNQRKGLQILQFLAESDEDTANEFMNKLSDKFTEIAKEMGVT